MEFRKKNFNCCATSLSKLFAQSKRFFGVVIQKIQAKIAGTLVGAAHVLKKVGDKCLELSRNYSVDPELGTWKETTVKRIINDEKDLPPEIQQKLQQQEEVNNTKTLNEALVCEM